MLKCNFVLALRQELLGDLKAPMLESSFEVAPVMHKAGALAAKHVLRIALS